MRLEIHQFGIDEPTIYEDVQRGYADGALYHVDLKTDDGLIEHVFPLSSIQHIEKTTPESNVYRITWPRNTGDPHV